MRIEEYEFEEENTLTNLAELLVGIAEQLREGKKLDLPMPTLREGTIQVPLGEPIETGIEVTIRRHFIHVDLALAWRRENEMEFPQEEEKDDD
ncbi:hypothetical protein EU546_06905 [Candidatus Thorarchaeota archaeon]|jgi:hypothetical protein|nr:MAG: hypothetical protein EU546_06905 [Candidatus Thorarchaeota archaeon]